MSSLAEPRRPRLLAQNRKLRHLRGIWLRNLSFAPTSLRTADDADLATSLNKLPVLRESGQLHPSRSSESLRKDNVRHDALRPQQKRRTSLSLAQVNPVTRQKNLETLFEETVGDVFYSLHVDGDAEPVYISEVRERSTSFNFKFFSLENCASAIARCNTLRIRVWARRPKVETWTFLLDESIDLRRLNFIGTLMDRKFPPNALIFHLEDGIYSFDFPNRISEPKQAPQVATSSYTALMKLANLESSIEDAIETQQRLMEEINNMLEDTPVDKSGQAQEAVSLAEKYVAAQQRSNNMTQKKRDDLRESIRARREAIAKGRDLQAQAETDMANNREKLTASQEALEETQQQIRGQRRRICSDLTDIFPITPIPNAPPLSFQICNIPLPNSTYDASTAKHISEDVLSAALGFVALLTSHLQFYLAHPLPYPLDWFGSRSYARDDISQLSDKTVSRREFPLYLPRGGSTAGQWRFEYAWFLLNKNIEALCSSQGLRVVDIRHSLPNLKYLLYVCSAGSDQVPERKKGGVRGLWAGRLKGRMSTMSAQLDGDNSSLNESRRDSTDSEMNQQGDALRAAVLKSNGHDKTDAHDKNDAHLESLDDLLSLPFGEVDTKFTLRTKGLRENVSR
ncbi:UV radiation resistance protein and autophagy-related subunit 14-domain-containing protein [Fusarium flagelliforme]|uniref:Uv radiation resistance associated protein p63 n=1 Tax=Fusarium flagelliforme TaxID=2675880 RepID=A0A395MAJ7_9HYPO|nr:UV radiation resistance protein and autophagy-related subunit 14-domain-containing protein [Fusarium flagelliforme]KAH7179260.1 UV radiation resistance protein and autophagy-related subunit 14-domain-containing protein [Fusarium flagelliforme]RFN44109.1 uv radiation resistance associated protein p63 [Fusarium flagelliforme]